MTRKTYDHVIAVGAGRAKADVCIRHANILDIFNKEWFEGDLLIADGYIAGFAESGKGTAKEMIDAGGRYLVPGFIDGHEHIESSYLTPAEFSNLVTPCGTTTVVADPHEITNVCGMDGLKYIWNASKHTTLSVQIMVPSCVPATSFEHSGANITAKDIHPIIGKERILGLAEMMNYPGVVVGTKFVLDKCWDALVRHHPVDGHAPGVKGSGLDAYVAAGIKTDHECETPEELKDRVRRGMYVMLRQGSACRNLKGLLPGVTPANLDRVMMCTDDRQPKTIKEEGHINNNVRMAVSGGIDPIDAIRMATINTAECYHLDDRGAIAPGRRADFLLLNNLKDFNPQRVFIMGRCVAENGYLLVKSEQIEPKKVTGRMHIKDFSVERLALRLKKNHVRVIDIIPGGVVTAKGEADVTLKDGVWVHDPHQDILKVAVLERHHGLGTVGLGLLRGYGLKHGAIATTVAHDSHNVICIGDNDPDMALAVQDLVGLGGGMTIVRDGKVMDHLALPIAGLMSDQSESVVEKKLEDLHEEAYSILGVNPVVDPFMTLCFMALPVIPAYKVTDMGLFDVTQFKLVPLEL